VSWSYDDLFHSPGPPADIATARDSNGTADQRGQEISQSNVVVEDCERSRLNEIASEPVSNETESSKQFGRQDRMDMLMNQNTYVIGSNLGSSSSSADSEPLEICDINTGTVGTLSAGAADTLSEKENLHTSSIVCIMKSSSEVIAHSGDSENFSTCQLAKNALETKHNELYNELPIEETTLVSAEASAVDNVQKEKDETEPTEMEEGNEEEEYTELTAADIKAEAGLPESWQPVFKTDAVPPPPPTKCEDSPPPTKLEDSTPSSLVETSGMEENTRLFGPDQVYAVVFLGVSVITDMHGCHYNQIG
jgi:hypothetical protein